MAETLAMEARLKDFMSANLDTIIKKLDETAKKADSTGNSLSSMAAKAETSLGKFSFTTGYSGKAVEELGKKVDATGKAAEQTSTKYGNFTSAVQSTVQAFAGMFIVNQVTGMIMKFAEAGDKQAVAQAELANALGYTSVALTEQATALQQVTRYGDEDTMAAQARMAAFIKDENMIKRLIPLVQDFAAAKKMDLVSASDLVTKSITSQTSMLGRYGIAVEGDGKTVERFNSVVKGLEDTFKGTAKTIGEAGIGPFKIMQNNLGDIGETIGTIVTPAINEMAESLSESLGIWNEWLTALQKGKNNSKDITDGLIEQAIATGDVSAIQSKLLEMDAYRLKVGNAMITEGKTLSYWNKINNESLKEEQKLREALNKIKAKTIGPQAEKFSGEIDPDVIKKREEAAKKAREKAEKAREKAEKAREKAEKEWEQTTNIESAAYMSKLKAQTEFQDGSLKAQEIYNKDRLAQMDAIAQLSIKSMSSEFDQERAQLAIDIEEKKNAIFAFETFTINSKEQAAEMRIKLAEYERTQLKAIGDKEAKDNKEINDKKVKQEQQTADLKVEILKSLQNSTMVIMNLAKGRNREVFNVFKAMSIAEATISTAVSAVKAFQAGMSSGGGIATRLALAIGGAAAAGIAGGIQIATISAQKYAVGTSRAPAGMAMVGEQGPELLELPLGTRVHSALDTRQIVNNSNTSTNNNGGNVLNITVNDQTTGKALTDMIRSGELDTFIIDFKRRGNLR